MRVALFGQATFGRDTLIALQEAGEQIVGVSGPSTTTSDKHPDALATYAEEIGVPILDTRSLRESEPLDAFRTWEPDLLVFAFVTEIVRPEVLEVPQHGTIQYHPSLLPRHRGRSAMNWAIAAGETTTGLTVFWVDEGIDTGPILLQHEIPIHPNDTVGSIYFNKLYPQGIESLVEAVGLVREGTAPRTPQDENLATYEPPMGRTHAALDWSRPARRLYDHLRSCDPQPGARALLNETEIRLFDGELHEKAHRTRPGTVLRSTDGGAAEVAVIGGVLTVGHWR